MADNVHLDNAPIAEAIIDIRVDNSDDITLDTLKEVTKALPDNYTDIKEQNRILTEVHIEAGNNPRVKQQDSLLGYICRTKDGHNVAQIQLDGFTFSELKPYSDWNAFSDRAKEIWDVYCGATDCDRCLRIAVRYINHMELPIAHGDDLGKYLTSLPDIPKKLPQAVANFLTRITISKPDDGATANITEALLPQDAEKEGYIKVLLDIDVFKQIGYSNSKDEIWATLVELKSFENEVFFSFITEEARELFK